MPSDLHIGEEVWAAPNLGQMAAYVFGDAIFRKALVISWDSATVCVAWDYNVTKRIGFVKRCQVFTSINPFPSQEEVRARAKEGGIS